MVTITSIAKELNISKSTVARAINGEPVKESTRKKVLQAVKDMGYVPNLNAVRMGIKSKKILHIHMCKSITDEYDSAILEGIHHYLDKNKSFKFDMQITASNTETEQIDKIAKGLLETPDIIIISPISQLVLDESVNLAMKKNIPVVTLDMIFQHKEAKHIGPNYHVIGATSINFLQNYAQEGRLCLMEFEDNYCLSKAKIHGALSVLSKDTEKEYIHVSIPSIDLIEKVLTEKLNKKSWYYMYPTFYADKVHEVLIKNGFNKVFLISNDRNERTTTLLKEKKIHAIIHQKPFFLGYCCMRTVFALLFKSLDFTANRLDTGLDILLAENLYYTEKHLFTDIFI